MLDVRNGDRKTFIGNGRESPNMHAGINSVMGMAIDWIGENLYWTDEGIASHLFDNCFDLP